MTMHYFSAFRWSVTIYKDSWTLASFSCSLVRFVAQSRNSTFGQSLTDVANVSVKPTCHFRLKWNSWGRRVGTTPTYWRPRMIKCTSRRSQDKRRVSTFTPQQKLEWLALNMITEEKRHAFYNIDSKMYLINLEYLCAGGWLSRIYH